MAKAKTKTDAKNDPKVGIETAVKSAEEQGASFMTDIEAAVEHTVGGVKKDMTGLAVIDDAEINEKNDLGKESPAQELEMAGHEAADVAKMTDRPANPKAGANDPNASVAGFLLAVGRVYNEMGALSKAAHAHQVAVAAQPELHGFVNRIELACGEFRHVVEQLETGMSEELHQAIQDGIMAVAHG